MRRRIAMDHRRIIAAAAVLAMAASAVSCGSDAGESKTETTSAVTVEEETEETTKTGEKSANDEKKSEKTTAKTDAKTSEKTTAAKSAATTKAASGSTSGGSASGGKSSGGSSSGGNSSGSAQTNAASGGGQTSSETTPAAEEEVKEYTAEITLGSSPKVTGSNVTVDGTVVTITAGGDYIFTGSVDNGQICVDTGVSEDKVTVVLNGVTITNTSAPAIFIREAKRCTIKPKEGSVNTLESGVEKKGVKDTGVIFSNDTVRLKGNGELNIKAIASHGINSDDDVVIESGTYNIDSRKSGIIANVGVTLNGGKVNITGGTNGIKAKGDEDAVGTVTINGGAMYVSGGTKEEKHSIYAAEFNYAGGTVFAAGNKFTQPTTSAAPYAGFGFKNGGTAGSELRFYVNGIEKGSLTPHMDFMSAVMFLPDLCVGDKVSVSVDGNSMGDFEITGTKNEFVVG